MPPTPGRTTSPIAASLPASTTPSSSRRGDGRRRKESDGWLFGLDQPTYVAVVTDGESEALRRAFYEAWSTRASDQGPGAGKFDNTAVMDDILRLRHEAARLLDFASYRRLRARQSHGAHGTRGDRTFLRELVRTAKPAGAAEFAELEQFAGRRLNAWDVTFYSERLQQSRYSVTQEELRDYLPLPRVLAGLFEVAEKLFDVRIRERTGVQVWHPDVRYFEVQTPGDTPVASFYLDAYARPHKRSGAWMDDCVGRKALARAHHSAGRLPGVQLAAASATTGRRSSRTTTW